MQPNVAGRRPSLSHVSGDTTPSGRKQSIGGATPMLASSSMPSDLNENRRGSLIDLAQERLLSARATQQIQKKLQVHRDELVKILRAHTVEEILPCIDKTLVEINGSYRPVDAFEILLENQIESAPVYIESNQQQILSNDFCASKSSKMTSSSSSSPLRSSSMMTSSSITRSLTSSPSSSSSTTSSKDHENSCEGRDYTGFLDIRDLVSSMIFVAVQPINEDELVYTSTGAEVPVSLEGPAGLEEFAQATANASAAVDQETAGSSLSGSAAHESGFEMSGASAMAVAASAAISAQVSSLSEENEPEEEENDEFGRMSLSGIGFGLSSLASLAEGPVEEGDETELSPQPDMYAAAAAAAASTASAPAGTITPIPSSSPSESHWNETLNKGLSQLPGGGNLSAGGKITVRYLSRRNPFRAVKKTSNLYEVAQLFSTGLNRVPVVSDTGICIDVISQNDMIKFIHKYVDEMSSTTLGASAIGLLIGTKSVKEVREDFTALETFVRMDEERLSGLAIVDAEGRFLNATSSRDLKRFALDKGKTSLNQPILSYLASTRGIANIRPFKTIEETPDFDAYDEEEEGNYDEEENYAVYEQRDYTGLLSGAVTVERTVTVQDVITALATAGVNRAFCLDQDDTILQVISISDIMKFACGMTTL